MLVFNRPEHTARVFAAVRRARPETLYVVADGPRPDRPGEAEACARTRAVFDGVDWPCDVVRIFSDGNMGCRDRVVSGITEVFGQVDRCIFLEDDCVPDPTFVPYCEDLLERYATDERVMAISGDGFTSAVGNMRFPHSYYFTRFVHVWGWATWRRAWKHNGAAAARWPEVRNSGFLRKVLGSWEAALYWKLWLEQCFDRRINTWDIPWVFACWLADGLSICPDRNLVSNIGFDGTGTHTTGRSPLAGLATTPMDFPLRHPGAVVRHRAADEWTQRYCYTGSLRQRWKRVVRYVKRGVKAGV
jgi:hypothetical protein